MDDDDVGRREVDAGVCTAQRRVVPFLDRPQKDSGKSRRRELQVLSDSWHVVGRYDRAEHRRKVENLHFRLSKLLVGHRPVARAEIDGAGEHLPDPAAGANRLVVNLHLRVALLVLVEPFGVQRIGKGRSGAGHFRVGAGRRRRRGTFAGIAGAGGGGCSDDEGEKNVLGHQNWICV